MPEKTKREFQRGEEAKAGNARASTKSGQKSVKGKKNRSYRTYKAYRTYFSRS